jgi:hypothetical protein
MWLKRPLRLGRILLLPAPGLAFRFRLKVNLKLGGTTQPKTLGNSGR